MGWASHSLGLGRPHSLALGSDLPLFARCSLEASASPCCSSSESTRFNPLPLQTLPPRAMPAAERPFQHRGALIRQSGGDARLSLPVPSCVSPCLDASQMGLPSLCWIADLLQSVPASPFCTFSSAGCQSLQVSAQLLVVYFTLEITSFVGWQLLVFSSLFLRRS